jgi:DNA primase
VIVCEGLPDALSTAEAGSRAVAILGTGVDAASVAAELHRRFPDGRLVIAMDSDDSGRNASFRLGNALQDIGHDDLFQLELPERFGDLNAWLCGNAPQFLRELQVIAQGPEVDTTAVQCRAMDLAPVSLGLGC